jgi:tRNA(Ile)-lysidine synthase
MEQTAREERYRRLELLLADTSGSVVLPRPRHALTAHHLGDQAETVLFNLIRGTHLKGLRGIAECYRERIWRPWLRLSPDVLAQWVAEQGIEHVTDSTNRDLSLSRNKLRHEVLPRLLEINPRAREHISRLGLAASTAHRYLERSLVELEITSHAEGAIDRWLPLMAWPPGDYIAHYNRAGWDNPELLSIYAGRELEERLGGLGAEEYSELARWAIEDDAPVTIRGWQVGLPHRTVLALASPPEDAGVTPELILREGRALPVGGLSAGLYTPTAQGWQQFQARRRESWEYIRSWGPELAEMAADPPEQPSWYCYLPPGVAEPLTLRAWRAGDSIKLPGGGTKKLGDIFTDAKLPQCFRPVWAVLTDARGEVLWVPGLADSARMQLADGVEPARLVLLKESR